MLTSIILIILISVASIYFKMKYDEKKNKNQFIIREQQARITLYLKHNTIGTEHNQNLYISQTWKQVLWEVL